jgi:hypothetical protein
MMDKNRTISWKTKNGRGNATIKRKQSRTEVPGM